jgi:sulfur carrier protein
MVTVTVNGEKRQVQKDATVSDLLAELGIAAGRRVAVERNREIVKRETWDSTAICENDVFEIIEFVGGGC